MALQNIIREIHKARVVHGDPYPRNMMVQPETDRVLWIDFDRAQTLPYGPLDFYVQDWFEMDVGMTDQLMDELVGHQILFEFIILPLVQLLTLFRRKTRKMESSLVHGSFTINIHDTIMSIMSFITCTYWRNCILDLVHVHCASCFLQSS